MNSNSTIANHPLIPSVSIFWDYQNISNEDLAVNSINLLKIEEKNMNSTIANHHPIPLVSIFLDYQNMSNKILAACLINFAQSKGKLSKAFAFDNWNQKLQDQEYLKAQGFECKQIYSAKKDAADHELLIDLGLELGTTSPDIIILVTGDHFALPAIKRAHDHHKKVIVISRSGNCCQELKNQADEFYLEQELIEKFPAKTNEQKPYLNYHEAVYYLIKAIKTCLAKGKPSIQQRVESFMRNILKISKLEILKPDGTKFSKFCEFLETVIQDDIITIRNEQLFVI